MGRLFLRFLVGGISGVLVWMICEPAAPKTISDAAGWNHWEQTFVLFLGAAIGLAVGGLDGYMRGGKIHTIRGVGLGLLFGAIACPLGYGVGGRISDTIFGSAVFLSGNLVTAILARTIAFAFIGAFLGAPSG